MKTTKLLYIGVALLLAGCSVENAPEEGVRVPVRLGYSVVQAKQTRAAQDLNDDHFAVSDKIKVGISNTGEGSYTYYDYVATNSSTGAMAPASSPMAFYPLDGTKIDIIAYYPSTASTTFTVKSNQTSDEAYKASDLMFANTDGTNPLTNLAMTTSARTLKFEHKMAKIMVNATAGTGVTYITDVTLKSIKPTVTFATETGSVTEATGSTDIIMSNNGAALIPAQTIDGTFLEIATNVGIATYSLASKEFVAGKAYTLNITVNSVAIGANNTIEGWDDTNSTVQVDVHGALTLNDLTPASFTYDGTAKTHTSLTVKCGDVALDPSDYDLTYYNNTNAGTAVVSVQGKNGYADYSGFGTFTISKAAGSISFEASSPTLAFSNKTYKNTFSHTGDGRVTYSSNNPNVATVDAETGQVSIIKVGSAVITATVSGGVNYDYSSTTTNYTLSVSGYSTLSELRTAASANTSVGVPYMGCHVDGYGNISRSSTGSIGIIVYTNRSAVDTSFPDSRILVFSPRVSNATVHWRTNTTSVEETYRSIGAMNGYSFTSTHNTSEFPAAKLCWDYNSTVSTPTGASKWFLPSYAQWNALFPTAKSEGLLSSEGVWSSTEYSGNTESAYRLDCANGSWATSTKNVQLYYIYACFVY